MKKRTIAIIAILLSLLLLIFLVYLSTKKSDTTLMFTVTDKVSKGWVWDLTVTFQNRVTRGFYQSDKAPFPFRFTFLTPGTYDLKLTAPSYIPVTIPVKILKGKNTLPAPVEMEGYEIPGFKRFYIFSKQEGSDLVFEFRPADAENLGIRNHPCLDLWIGCKIYAQVMNGKYVTAPTESGSETGELLFKGKIPWEWDSTPGNIYRYTARVAVGRIRRHPAPYRAIEFLVILPDPRKTSRAELDKLITPLLDLEDRKEVAQILEKYSGKLFYHLDENWNVPAPR